MKKQFVGVDFSNAFKKQLKKAPTEIKKAFKKRYNLFLEEPFHSQLNNHQLTGKFKGHRSINITVDLRAIYSERTKKEEKVIVFVLLGTHSQLYR